MPCWLLARLRLNGDGSRSTLFCSHALRVHKATGTGTVSVKRTIASSEAAADTEDAPPKKKKKKEKEKERRPSSGKKAHKKK